MPSTGATMRMPVSRESRRASLRAARRVHHHRARVVVARRVLCAADAVAEPLEVRGLAARGALDAVAVEDEHGDVGAGAERVRRHLRHGQHVRDVAHGRGRGGLRRRRGVVERVGEQQRAARRSARRARARDRADDERGGAPGERAGQLLGMVHGRLDSAPRRPLLLRLRGDPGPGRREPVGERELRPPAELAAASEASSTLRWSSPRRAGANSGARVDARSPPGSRRTARAPTSPRRCRR